MKREIDFKKYLFTFMITAAIFATAIYLSNYFGQKKIDQIRAIQDNISLDILSSETQFSLLEESSCQAFGTSSALSQELGSLEDKLSATERDRGANNAQVLTLKKYYSLLEIKDYILMKKIAVQCKIIPLSIIYFYSNKGDCVDCEREGYVLTHLREEYPTLRVYSFDYNLDISAVKTLFSVNKIKDTLPAIYMNGKIYYGFQSVDTLEATPQLTALRALQNASSTTATTTKTVSE